MLNIIKVIDQWGWAYDFISRDQQKYSKHSIIIERIMDFDASALEGIDVVYFSSPDLHPKVNRDINIIRRKWPKVKIIGGYAGEVTQTYQDIDVLISISAKYLPTVQKMYPTKEVVWLPECIDTDYFKKVTDYYPINLTPGWVGRPCEVKRPHLLDQLDYTVLRKQDWGHQFFQKGRTQDDMKEFYEKLSCLVLVSRSECMPRVVLEAMSMSLPVIATDVGSLRMVMNPQWLVGVEESQTKAGTNALLKTLDMDREHLKFIGACNRAYIEENYSWWNNMPVWDTFFNLAAKGDTVGGVKELYIQKFGHLEPSLC